MELQKLNVKFLAVQHEPVPPAAFVEVFHNWIQASDGLYHDVADYSHMHAGPGIILVAHEANVSIDETGNRRGLLYNHKAPCRGSNQEKLRHVFRAAAEYCRRIEQEATLRGKISFRLNEAELIVNDRLLAPNTAEAFLAIREDLERFCQQLYGTNSLSLERDADPRKRLTVRIAAPGLVDIPTLQRRLEPVWEERTIHA